MRIAPLGPEAIRARIEEIRSRMASPTSVDVAGGGPATSELSGAIGPGQMRPMNPLAPGMSIGPSSEELKPLIERAAAESGIDSGLLDALVATESGYNPKARSSAGAMGLTQLMPGTARGLGVSDPFDPWQNLSGGARYLSQMIRKFGDVRTALAAYNAGPGAVERAGGIPRYAETQAYVEKVMRLYQLRGRP